MAGVKIKLRIELNDVFYEKDVTSWGLVPRKGDVVTLSRGWSKAVRDVTWDVNSDTVTVEFSNRRDAQGERLSSVLLAAGWTRT